MEARLEKLDTGVLSNIFFAPRTEAARAQAAERSQRLIREMDQRGIAVEYDGMAIGGRSLDVYFQIVPPFRYAAYRIVVHVSRDGASVEYGYGKTYATLDELATAVVRSGMPIDPAVGHAPCTLL